MSMVCILGKDFINGLEILFGKAGVVTLEVTVYLDE